MKGSDSSWILGFIKFRGQDMAEKLGLAKFRFAKQQHNNTNLPIN
jgi:hypothetical protein